MIWCSDLIRARRHGPYWMHGIVAGVLLQWITLKTCQVLLQQQGGKDWLSQVMQVKPGMKLQMLPEELLPYISSARQISLLSQMKASFAGLIIAGQISIYPSLPEFMMATYLMHNISGALQLVEPQWSIQLPMVVACGVPPQMWKGRM